MKHSDFLWLILLIVGCSTPDSDISNTPYDPKYGNLPTALVNSLEQISEPPTKFTFSADEEQTFVSEKGTLVLIPKNALVDENGNPPQGEVTLELKEYFDPAEMILGNLQTMHNGQLLETRGMLYTEATDEAGNQLQIIQGKNIRMEVIENEMTPLSPADEHSSASGGFSLPVETDSSFSYLVYIKAILDQPSDRASTAKIFSGNRKEDGSMNWDIVTEQDKRLIAYPLLDIARNPYSGNRERCFDHYNQYSDFGGEGSGPEYFEKFMEYEGTLVATKEFAERYYILCDQDIWRLYSQNIDKKMWEIDSLLRDQFVLSYDYDIKRKSERLAYMIANGAKREDITEKKEEIDQGKEIWKLYKTRLDEFVNERFTTVDNSLVTDSAYLAKVQAMKSKVAKARKRAEKQEELRTAVATITQLGWVNVDYFYNNADAIELKLEAQANADIQMMQLIIPERNIMMSGNWADNGKFWFTKKGSGYTRLPKGEEAVIIAIGLDENDKPVYARKDIIIGNEELVKLSPRNLSKEQLKVELKKLNTGKRDEVI